MLRRILFVLILTCILPAADAADDTASPREQLDILLKSAYSFRSPSPRKTIEYATRALNLSRQLKNKTYEGLALQEIGAGYQYSYQYKKALDYYHQARFIFESIDDKEHLADLWRQIGYVFMRFSDYKSALESYNQGLGYLEKTGDKKKIAYLLNNKGLVYYLWGKLDTAMEYFMEAIKITEKLGTAELNRGYCTVNLGRTYRRLEDYDNAMRHLNGALTIAKEVRSATLNSFALREISEVYKKQGKFDNALDYCNKAMNALDKKTHKRQKAAIWVLSAEIYFDQKRFQKALDCARLALKKCREVGSKARTATSLTLLGRIRKEMGQLHGALEDLKQGAEIAKQLNLTETLQNCYLYLYQTFSAMGDSEQSLRYYKMYNEVKENVFNNVSTSRIRNTHVKFETEKINKEVEEVKTSKKIVFRVFSGMVLVLGLVLALVLYNRRRIKKRAQILLEQKNREIEFHKKNTNSLREQVKEFLSQKNKKKYEGSNLTPQQEELYLKKLTHYMKLKRPYLDGELSVKRLAAGLSVSQRDLSRVINEGTGMHFYDFVNRYRVEESKRLLQESILKDDMSILGIAYEVGFNSKSSFNTAFKKATGITPSQYRKAAYLMTN